jgi:hypothetical protein
MGISATGGMALLGTPIGPPPIGLLGIPLSSGGGGSSGPRMEGMWGGQALRNIPEHVKDRIYAMMPQGMGMRISQKEMQELRKHNLAPPTMSLYGSPLKAPTVNQALRALAIKKNEDPEYLPSGERRPPPVPEPVATGAPIDVSQGAVSTDINAIQPQATSIEAIRQQFLASQGLQPAGANLVHLLAQQQAERFSPNIEAIKQAFLTG